MGYFLKKFGYTTSITEAEVDGQDMSDTEAQDYTNSEQDTNNDNTSPEAGGDETTSNNDGADNAPAPDDNADSMGDEPTDYTEEGDEATEGEETPMEDQGPPVDEIKQQEEELIGLTPQQLDIKHEELKKQYLTMFDIITALIERIDDANVDKDKIKSVEFVSDTLAKLKSTITDYIDKVYSTKSYLENSINYNRFLAVLNGVNRILEEMNKKEDK